MKLLIFGIAIVTLGAISQAKAAPIEFGEAKPYPRLVEGKALLRPWEIGGVTQPCRHDALLPAASPRAVSPPYDRSLFVDV